MSSRATGETALCPACGRVALPGEQFCGGCGRWLGGQPWPGGQAWPGGTGAGAGLGGGGRVIGPGPGSAAGSCPRCSQALGGDGRYCTGCGLDLAGWAAGGGSGATAPPADPRRGGARGGTTGAAGPPGAGPAQLRRHPPSPATFVFLVVVQLVLLGLALYMFNHDHTVSGRIFVGGILLAALVNIFRGLSLVSAARRLRAGDKRRGGGRDR